MEEPLLKEEANVESQGGRAKAEAKGQGHLDLARPLANCGEGPGQQEILEINDCSKISLQILEMLTSETTWAFSQPSPQCECYEGACISSKWV